jgi:hypothetical protein
MVTRRAFVLMAGFAFASAALSGLTAPARADEAVLEPLKAIYASIGAAPDKEPFSARLGALHAKAVKRSEELMEPVSGLDFMYAVNGQDYEEGLEATVRYEIVSQEGDRAEVTVRYHNFEPQELHYDLVREDGVWLVDDVRYKGEEAEFNWTLSDLLAEGGR